MTKLVAHLSALFVTCLLCQFSLAQRINVIAGNGSSAYSGDGGAATAASLYAPVCIITDPTGTIEYISDKSNNRIRKVSASGVITTYAGTGTAGYSGDGGPATAARLNTTGGLTCDAAGNLYIADEGNHCIRKVTPSGTITTIAGTGSSGFSGDGGPATAATLNLPEDVAIDPSGSIYIADYGNSRVRKVSPSGVITTLAGVSSFGSSGDGGPATAAQVVPYRLALDAAGNVYEAEFWAHRIRKIDISSGIINTVVGNGLAGYSGDGGPATAAVIDGPYGIAIDKYGNMFINDQNNRRIRKVDGYGIIRTFAGNGYFGYLGDGGYATAARLGDVRNVAVNDTGDIFFADMTYNRCRVIRNTNHYPVFTAGTYASFSTCIGVPFVVNTALRVNEPDTTQTMTWYQLSGPLHGSLSGLPYSTASTGGVLTPTGITYAPSSGYTGADSFRIRIFDGMLSDTITVLATVVPLASAGYISGAPGVCLGLTTALTASVAGGTWSVTTANTSVTGTGLVTGLTNGPDTIRYRITNMCSTDIALHPIVVESPLDLGSIAGPDSVCPGHTVLMTHSYPGGTWFTSDTLKAKSVGGGIILGLTPGPVDIIYVVWNSCGPDTVRKRNFFVSSAPDCAAGLASAKMALPSLAVTPNPSSGSFTISTGIMQTINVSITDMLGRQVMSCAITGEKEVQLNLAPGSYIVTATLNGTKTAQRMTIVR